MPPIHSDPCYPSLTRTNLLALRGYSPCSPVLSCPNQYFVLVSLCPEGKPVVSMFVFSTGPGATCDKGLTDFTNFSLLTPSTQKLKKKLPPSFQSIRARRENLYLVTETLKTAKEETLKSQRWYRFWSQIYLGDLNYERKHPREETIPPNWVLGYRIKQLIFPNEEEMSICFQGKTKSFPEEKGGGSSCLGRSLNSEGSRNMKEKVQAMVISLQDLTEEERRDVLSSLTKCLSDDEYLEDLEQRVFEALISGELQMEGSSGPLLSSLFNIAGVLIEARAETILDFLDALIELSEKQLVAECLEKGTLPLLKDQVESMLEQVWDKQASNPHDVSCDLEARTLCALYATVSILLQLSSEPTSASS
ncbi:gasdermin-B isoform X5 [Eulemur rufifrons]|uniref:gasdermin-B isoform X5 n=1 Tax=Eulemur rufifrons TaxID=859984 RepID=UPI003742D568